ncbi:MAG: hypothetical protein PHE84_06595 [bacterium]|nr:hypothetical protein [bacterium]
MKIHFFQQFPGIEPDKLNEIWSDPEVIVRIVKALPNIQEREILEEKQDEKFLRRKVRYLAKGPIPAFAEKVLRPDMLSWVEETVFDKKNMVYQVKCVPHFFADRVENELTIRLLPDGKGGTLRVIEGVLNLKVPFVVRGMAEHLVNRYLQDNTEKEYQVLKFEVENYLSKKASARKKTKESRKA